ncbi:hypothetical protein [Chitinophaga sp. S165]|uniref:hypothetical protein n=1 Tax=Chitinophaga sp. S165 TaxID=2135462 RepID=UPI000D71944E|nr:hypothetical protein [Chitinophaga sp. S165]PWV56976.1 hypothetical protein C7475_1011496 [Chitinophaga sp. S165]
MKKIFLAVLLAFTTLEYSHAQTKVFKEVSEGISTKLKTIMQDGALVGYLSFTELERSDKDSFNYKITIMDENLNDLGVVTFKELKLDLRQVSFEKDILCLAYLKSNVIGYEFSNRGNRNEALKDGYMSVFAQFITLDGKIARTAEKKLTVKVRHAWDFAQYNNDLNEALKIFLQMKNIKEKGFAFFFADNEHNYLLVYNTQGELLWEKYITEIADHYYMLTSWHDVHLLLKKDERVHLGGYTLISYDVDNKSGILKYPLEDKKKNPLQVVSFDNDPATGRPFISGYILKSRPVNNYETVKGLTKRLYKGVFTISVTGHDKSDVQQLFTYWDDNSNPNITRKGYMSATHGYMIPGYTFRDYTGNTYFAGSNMSKKTRWGCIASSVITAPLIMPPLFILGSAGTSKFRITDGVLIKQDSTGKLTQINSIEAARGRVLSGRAPGYMASTHSFYTVSASDTKSTFLIMDDDKKATIYNVDQHKIIRTIPHKDGNVRTSLYPAKEGHVIVSEYNKKEKYTKFSIESI